MNKDVFLGENPVCIASKPVLGNIVDLEGEKFYRISNYDSMSPFFMTIVSDSDHWMFISSNGGLTCGRRNPENALFPYYTDDKIHDASASTGPLCILLIERNDRTFLWEPFNPGFPDIYRVERNLYKSTAGNKLIFEAINQTLQVKYRYAWLNSDAYGFVKRSSLTNLGSGETTIASIDGIRNILPYGVSTVLQSNMSTLVDGYKKCELHEPTGLGIYTLSSILSDKAEPSEALKATTVWAAGLKNPRYLLSENQIKAFRDGIIPHNEKVLKGKRGAYLVYDQVGLQPGGIHEWMMVADINQGPSDVPATINKLRSDQLMKDVLEDVHLGTQRLIKLVGLADGIQHTGNTLKSARHFSNTLFNIMRGGVFPNGYAVQVKDFSEFIAQWNRKAYQRNLGFISGLSDEFVEYQELLSYAGDHHDDDFLRLVYEYLPLTFSRRHGDPSRPWNRFSIDVKTQTGEQSFSYQGNWRDIFQNWEALSISFPGFIESFIFKFVDASTIDGYNPYRITRDGFDWEVLDPKDPWSNIGYWGDHQVIYLVKLMELSLKYHPGKIRGFLTRDLFVYANVPYRILPYASILENPRETIEFDEQLAQTIAERVAGLGADGKLITAGSEICKVNLTEKLLVTLLTKLSNFIPGGGIWMNTQRPEWNDANNALVGNGLSMVTLCYIRRFLGMLLKIFEPQGDDVPLTKAVHDYFHEIYEILKQDRALLRGTMNNTERRRMTDALGSAGSVYREAVYQNRGMDHRGLLSMNDLFAFLNHCLAYVDHTIAANRREDKLFHSYNLVEFGDHSCSIHPLVEMLEGQVAVISSGYLSATETLEVLDALRSSKMYRPDQRSYTLYPDKELKPFLEKNLLNPEIIRQSGFLSGEIQTGNKRIVEKDEQGAIHFNGSFRNVNDLLAVLNGIEGIHEAERDLISDAFLETFHHKQFTGRSGSFFKYEGLGSIYWHMVSKLMLAVQEAHVRASHEGAGKEILSGLKAHLDQIEEGIGVMKSPLEYGAFPIDPYSHTPGFAGVQQPGMTGQVKEDMISRFGELGVSVEKGCIAFNPVLLSDSEFLSTREECTLSGQHISLSPGQLGFTMCGIPVIYSRAKEAQILVEYRDGERVTIPGHILSAELSSLILKRSGSLSRILVNVQGTA